MGERTRSALGESLHVHGEAVGHVEALYLQHEGEVTDEIEQAEAARDLSAREALEHVIRYLAWCDDQDAAVARERERLDGLTERTARRRAWAEAKAVELAEAVAPGKTKVRVGTRTVKLRPSTAVLTGEDYDVTSLPIRWQRPVPEVPAKPATVALDKKAAKADLALGFREGEPPGDGWYDIEGEPPERWFLRKIGGEWRRFDAWCGKEPEGIGLDAFGFSIEPQAGLDVLRWCPAAPGVTLERRTHVKIG